MRSLRKIVSLLASAALLCSGLSACAQLHGVGGQTLVVEADDPCGPQRQQFLDSQNYFSEQIAVRAATGALIGAAGGAVIGGLANGGNGAVVGALAGALAGGLLGATTGYWDKLQQQNADQQQLAQTVNDDLRRESSQIDHTTATFASLRGCRLVQARLIKANAHAGRITTEQAQAMLARERAWFDQEVGAAQQVGTNMEKRDDQFTYATNNLTKAPRPAHLAASAQVAATETIPQKRNSFDNTVKTAQAQSATAFSLDTSSNPPDPMVRYG